MVATGSARRTRKRVLPRSKVSFTPGLILDRWPTPRALSSRVRAASALRKGVRAVCWPTHLALAPCRWGRRGPPPPTGVGLLVRLVVVRLEVAAAKQLERHVQHYGRGTGRLVDLD